MKQQAKYKQLAQQLISKIEQRIYTSDKPLPSLRSFCDIQQISMTTALACYRYVESQGYITAHPKRGYFVTTPVTSQIKYDFPNFVAKPTQSKQSARYNELTPQSLATAELGTSLVDHKVLSASLAQACRHSDLIWGYACVQGEATLRLALSKHFSTQGFALSEQDISITHGCLDAVQLAISVVSNEHDVILVSSPCYSGLLDMLHTLKRRVIEIPSTHDGIDLAQMEYAIQQHNVVACLLTANHQNPTGHSLSNSQKRQITQLANTYQLPIIEDDVFREISHNRTPPLPIKHFDENGWVIWCASFSKSLSAGLRLGWCAPGRYFDAYITQQKVRTPGVNKPLQLAIAHYINRGHYQQHLKRANNKLASHKNLYITLLNSILPANSSIYIPHGGMVLWIKVPDLDSDMLAAVLASQHIFIKPGTVFGTTQHYKECFRLNFGLEFTADIQTQLNKIANEINKQLT